MDYDPLISSRDKSLVSWGTSVVLTLIVAFPVSARPESRLAHRHALFRNRQGLIKAKKNPKGKKSNGTRQNRARSDRRTRPDLAFEPSSWWPSGSPTR